MGVEERRGSGVGPRVSRVEVSAYRMPTDAPESDGTYDSRRVAAGSLSEFGGESKRESDDRAKALMDRLKRVGNPPSMKLFDDEAEEEHLRKVRESGLGATARIPGEKDAWEGWEDSAVPPERVGPTSAPSASRSRSADTIVHSTAISARGASTTESLFNMNTYEFLNDFREFLDEAGDLVVSHGGSISGEQGDGQSKAALLPKMFGPGLVRSFGEFEAIFDPDNKMSPHRVVDPAMPGENLRLGPAYHSLPQVETHFKTWAGAGEPPEHPFEAP